MSEKTREYYEVFLDVVKEASAYVMADGRRKWQGLPFPTKAMLFHKEQYHKLVGTLNGMARGLLIIPADEAGLFSLLTNTEMYSHKIMKGDRAGEREERTVCSARAAGYRKIIRDRIKNGGAALSASSIEQIYRQSDEYRRTLQR